MNGYAFWAHSVCRSTFALYREIGRQSGMPVRMAIWKDSERDRCGFGQEEFADLNVVRVGDDVEKARQFLNATPGFVQVFSAYQSAPAYRWAIAEAKARGERLIAYAEAPSNMERGLRRLVKEVYLRTVLPFRCRAQIAAFERLICASGNNFARARLLGWPQEKIVPFGYAVPGFGRQGAEDDSPFGTSGVLKILSTGVLSWHRGPDVLIAALNELKHRRVPFEAVVTQDGPMRRRLEAQVRRGGLPVRFVGKVSVEVLARLYRACDVFVASGREEPWGMRVNDAVNGGAAVVVSAGMGAAELVDETGCGCVVPQGEPQAIADCLERMARDGQFLKVLRDCVPQAAREWSVEKKAAEFIRLTGGNDAEPS